MIIVIITARTIHAVIYLQFTRLLLDLLHCKFILYRQQRKKKTFGPYLLSLIFFFSGLKTREAFIRIILPDVCNECQTRQRHFHRRSVFLAGCIFQHGVQALGEAPEFRRDAGFQFVSVWSEPEFQERFQKYRKTIITKYTRSVRFFVFVSRLGKCFISGEGRRD